MILVSEQILIHAPQVVVTANRFLKPNYVSIDALTRQDSLIK
jgi:hypothetical protein